MRGWPSTQLHSFLQQIATLPSEASAEAAGEGADIGEIVLRIASRAFVSTDMLHFLMPCCVRQLLRPLVLWQQATLRRCQPKAQAERHNSRSLGL